MVTKQLLTDLDAARLTARATRAIARPRYGAALSRFLRTAEIIPVGDMPADVITMFTTFVCIDVARRQTMIWTIVYPEEADFSLGRVCVFSAAGLALLGSRQGDVSVCHPNQDMSLQFEVRKILFQPKAAGIPELNRCHSSC